MVKNIYVFFGPMCIFIWFFIVNDFLWVVGTKLNITSRWSHLKIHQQFQMLMLYFSLETHICHNSWLWRRYLLCLEISVENLSYALRVEDYFFIWFNFMFQNIQLALRETEKFIKNDKYWKLIFLVVGPKGKKITTWIKTIRTPIKRSNRNI